MSDDFDGTTPEHKTAAEKRATAVREAGNPQLVAALLREREGYVVRGLADRVKAVDESLADAGYTATAAETAATPKPRTRKA